MPRESEYQIEPLGESHDRSRFHSGVAELDEYFRRQAGQDARRKVAAPFVMLDRTGLVIGYYTLSAYAIRLDILPKDISKRLPRYPLIPATLLGRLAVDPSRRGLGAGGVLLMDALHRSWRNTTEVASAGVFVDAIDGAARAFYLHYEFMALVDHPNRLFLPMATIERDISRVAKRLCKAPISGLELRTLGTAAPTQSCGTLDQEPLYFTAPAAFSTSCVNAAAVLACTVRFRYSKKVSRVQLSAPVLPLVFVLGGRFGLGESGRG